MAKTNFEKVMEFNRAFDMVKTPKYYLSGTIDVMDGIEYNSLIHYRPNLFKDEPKTIKLRLDLIKEEIEELNEAVKNNDFIETRDAIGDILYVVYGMCDVLGFNIDRHLPSRMQANYSNIKNGRELFERTEQFVNHKINSINLNNFIHCKIYLNEIVKMFKNPYTNNTSRIKECLQLINLYYETLENQCKNYNDNTLEIPNTLSDLLMIVYTFAILNDIDADADFAIIHDSNMSKLCDSESDAILTVSDYEDKFKQGKSHYDSPYYYYIEDLNKWIIKNKSTGKALKNIKYKKVAFN